MVNEFSFLSTGYSTYGRNVLERLHNSGKYEIAEFASYITDSEPRIAHVPWKVYGVMPDAGNEEQNNAYNSSGTNPFGEWKFEKVCLDFQPDIVFDIRDYWMSEFQSRSPYRPYYKWAIMPTVDALCQDDQWLSTYCSADAVLTYQDWSGKTLMDETGGKAKWVGSASPSAEEAFKPLSPEEKDTLRQRLGLPVDLKVLGTVMRNQRRKLYPELFEAFREYLDMHDDGKTVLYCHTSYPDRGWDIPALIKEYGLSSKVYFTYVCGTCAFAYPSLFQDAIAYCPQCKKQDAGLANVSRGVNPETLSKIYGIFDLYVQYANSEGFGIPQIEAAACGIPVASVDYSAMTDVVRKLKGYPIELKMLYKEMETGCKRAYPEPKSLIDIVHHFFSLPKEMRQRKGVDTRAAFEEHYSWDKTADKWMEVFDSLDTIPHEEGWGSPPRIHRPAPYPQDSSQFTNIQYAKWLIINVLGEPEKLNTYMETRLVRDLNYGVALEGIAGLYYNEQSHIFAQGQYNPFNREIAHQKMVAMCNRRNSWEQTRYSKISE